LLSPRGQAGILDDVGHDCGPIRITAPARNGGNEAIVLDVAQGVEVAVDFNVLFHGTQEYTIVCQSTASTTATVAEGCGAIRATFQVTG